MEPPNKGRIGTRFFVHLREAVHFLEVTNNIGGMLKQAVGTTKSVLWMEVNCYSECPLLEVPLYMQLPEEIMLA